MIFIISPPEHRCLVGAAEARHRLHQRVENRLEIDGRAADDLEYVGGGGLLLQRLREVARLRLHLLKQTDIADGDHRLIGKSLQQGNLLFAERIHFSATEQNRSDALALTHQGNTQISAGAGAARPFPGVGEFVAFDGEHVVYVH